MAARRSAKRFGLGSTKHPENGTQSGLHVPQKARKIERLQMLAEPILRLGKCDGAVFGGSPTFGRSNRINGLSVPEFAHVRTWPPPAERKWHPIRPPLRPGTSCFRQRRRPHRTATQASGEIGASQRSGVLSAQADPEQRNKAASPPKPILPARMQIPESDILRGSHARQIDEFACICAR